MFQNPDPLDLTVPRNLTALMQHLQLLVGREEHRLWCGGTVRPEKLESFVNKMASRYPITRNSRQRSYDRKREVAVVHFVAYPVGDSIRWWLLSDDGRGGLGDASAPDAHVAHDAMSASHHLTVDDYVLLYAHKKAPQTLTDLRSGKERVVLKDVSTWTWKLRSEAVSSIKAAIDECCARLEYGHEGDAQVKPWGLRGLLASLRRRPLFSGVRNQVVELHRYARDAWLGRRAAWLSRHPDLAQRYGDKAGALRPVNEVIASYLPKMPRIAVYGTPRVTLRELASGPMPRPPPQWPSAMTRLDSGGGAIRGPSKTRPPAGIG